MFHATLGWESYYSTFTRVIRLCRIAVVSLLVITFSIQSPPYAATAGAQNGSAFNSRSAQTTDSLQPASNDSQPGSSLYLPQVFNPDHIWQDVAIWAHNTSPAAHEIVLCRREFTLKKSLADAELHLFADTRYQVWLDGVQIGRGPARFSNTLHEYDVYNLGSLHPGDHLLAVRAQWAPNYRRSESTVPHLIGHIQGESVGKVAVSARTGSEWYCQQSGAWQGDAAPVHSWSLIGPTELLDLEKLPIAWNQPGFDDTAWTSAVPVNITQPAYPARSIPHLADLSRSAAVIDAGQLSPRYLMGEIIPPFPDPFDLVFSSLIPMTFTIRALATPDETAAMPVSIPQPSYQARSIPHLVDLPRSATVIDAGQLSPGYLVGEIIPPFPDPFDIEFSNLVPAIFTIRALAIPGETAAVIRLDGATLTWDAVDPDRPDLYAAEVPLSQGNHSLSFEGIPPRGMTFGVPAGDFQYANLPFSQGLHAGRRTLLADLVSGTGGVAITTGASLDLEFNHPPGYAVLDLGRTVLGRFHAQMEGPARTVVDVGWDERLAGSPPRPLPYPGTLHPEWDQVDSWILDGGTRKVENIDARGGRYILIAVWGAGPVKVKDIQVIEERYPAPVMGSFHSSDPLLDQIWQVGMDTLAPNMLDGYTDTPWRERGQWWGDASVADHINRVTLGDVLLLKRGLRYMADAFHSTESPGIAPNTNGTHITDYAMLWVANLSEYIQISGDRPFLREMYPVLLGFIDHLGAYENQATDLLDLPQTHWSQTAYIEPLGQYSRYGMSTALNALYYGTLQDAAYLADQADDAQRAADWKNKSDGIRQQVNELLYLPAENRYATNIYQGEVYPPTPHAQAWALAYDLVPPEQVDQVASALIELLSPDPQDPNLDIYGMYWVLEALGRSDHIPEGVEIIERYYGYMLDSGATAWWEQFDADQYYTASLSHVWGGSPTWFLSTYVLGAKWESPGRWSVSPAFSGVSHTAGSIPVDAGLLQVAWERQMCDQGLIDITSAEETSGVLTVPFLEQILEVTRDGWVIWENGFALEDGVHPSPGGLVIPLLGGHHSLSVHFDCSKSSDPPNRTAADPANTEP